MPTDMPTSVYHDGDGSTTDFVYPFPTLHPTHVKVQVDGVVTSRQLISTGTVRVTPAPPAGTGNVRVYRETQTGPMVTWTDGGGIMAADINKAALQSLYLAQEAVDTATAALELVDSIPAGPQGPPGNDGNGTGDMVRATYDPNSRNADVFDRANHTGAQAISTITSLQATLNAIDAALAGKADTSHTQAISTITGLQTALDGKAASSHTHAQADITGLVSALAAKANASHTHGISDINATGTPSASTFLRGDGSWSSGGITAVNVVDPGGANPNVADVNASISGNTLTITLTRD
jgi:hypothetical protein